MKHFDDPAISRMQSSLAHGIRKNGNFTDEKAEEQIAAHEHMQAFNKAAAELYEKRQAMGQNIKQSSLEKLAKVQKVSTCAEMFIKLALSHLYHRDADLEKLHRELDYSTCDPEWVDAIIHYLETYRPGFHHHEIPYVRYENLSDFVHEGLDDKLKVGILGDWGTGTALALQVLKNLVELEPDVIIHLGDVYYSGSLEEYRRKLVEPLRELARRKDGTRIPVFIMAGNHDMYSGGGPFLDVARTINERPEDKQKASYLCLRLAGEKWQILCANTALHDHDPFTVTSKITYLDPNEVEWHRDKVETFSKRGGRTIFMTHHQPFSPFAQLGSLAHKKPSDFYTNPRLVDDFHTIAENGDVPLWLWGHEHNLAIYEPYAGIERGRCIGHSAVPVLAGETDPYAVKRLGEGAWWEAIIGFLKGKWAIHVASEFIALRQLKSNPGAFPTPVLDRSRGEEVRLGVIPFDDHRSDAGLNMYEHGFAFLSFGSGPEKENVTVDYYGDNGHQPLFSETL